MKIRRGIRISLFLIGALIGCEDADKIQSILLTPEGEMIQTPDETTFTVTVKIVHPEDASTDILQPTVPPKPPRETPERVKPPVFNPPVEEPEPAPVEVSYSKDIQPILAERCAIPGCHAAPGAGGLNLRQYDTFKKGGNSGAVFDAGNGKGSLVVKRIDGGGMPPIPPRLTAEQVQLFVDWIDAGAKNN